MVVVVVAEQLAPFFCWFHELVATICMQSVALSWLTSFSASFACGMQGHARIMAVAAVAAAAADMTYNKRVQMQDGIEGTMWEQIERTR